MRNIKDKQLWMVFILLILVLLPQSSFAAIFMDKMATAFQTGTMKWQATIYGYAVTLFWELVGIDFVWTTIVWVKDRKEAGEIWAGYIGKLVSYGFFWFLLFNAGSPNSLALLIINSFTQIGQSAATAAGASVGTLDSVLLTGFNVSLNMFAVLYSHASTTDLIFHPIDVAERTFLIIPVFGTAIIVTLSFVFIAGELLVTQVESYIAIYGGIILLGLGGSRWTSDMASSYLKYAVSCGMKLMMCYLIIGLGATIFTQQIPPTLDIANIWSYILTIIPLSLLYVYLVGKIPSLVNSMMSGSASMGLGGMASTAITAAAGLAGAGAAASALGGGGAAKSAVGDALKSSTGVGLPSGGGASNLTGGGKSGVQPPGSGLGATNTPAGVTGGHPGGLAGDLAAESAASTAASVDSVASSTAASPSLISTDTSISNAKAAAASSSAAPSPSSGGGSSSASPTSGGSPAPSGGATTSSPSSTPVTAAAESSGSGNASGASVGADHPHTTLLESINSNLAQMAQNNAPQNPALHDKISSLQKFVPNDGASVSSPGISMGHTKD